MLDCPEEKTIQAKYLIAIHKVKQLTLKKLVVKIHIVDLDAAFGRPDVNINSIKKIRKSVSIPIQLGGGIRSITSAEKYFDLGIDNLIIGSMAINKIDSVKSISNKNKNKIYISLDIKDNNVMIKGWTQKSTLNVEGLLTQYKNSNIKGYIITDIRMMEC